MTHESAVEALERTLQEIEALSAIYNQHAFHQEQKASSSITFSVLTVEEYAKAQFLLDAYPDNPTTPSDLQVNIPTLRVQINIKLQQQDDKYEYSDAEIHIDLPPGYPCATAANVSVAYITNLTKNQREEICNSMNQKACDLTGSEAIMALIHFFQDSMTSCCVSNIRRNSCHRHVSSGHGMFTSDETLQDDDVPMPMSRCWIWVHHITNNGRCKDIVREAKERGLGGYLKRGYPGIVVIEGPSALCNDFVQWIKGSKSRPGGFGRNWGHHVRGEILMEEGSQPSFTKEFQDVGEDLASLASLCRESGVEDEFLKYVMQH